MMTEFAGRVVVITGAGSGFGREFARLGGQLGMRLVLADIAADALAATAAELREAGADVVAERVDVSVGADVERLERQARDAFGQVDLLFNNAGVAVGGLIWEHRAEDWEWVLGVNLWGVLHGIRAFVPGMIAQRTAGHVVNTASVAGLLAPPLMGVYNVGKHGVVAASETLFHDLRFAAAAIGCSVLCPAFVPTGIGDAARRRAAASDAAPQTDSQRIAQRQLERAVASGRIQADAVARMTFDAVREDRFYVLTHPRILDSVKLRHEDIERLRNPSDPYAGKPEVAARRDDD